MNNKLVINFVPGPTPVHKLAGSTKVLMFHCCNNCNV